ncbi:hypothetical protein KCTCHS21_02640 [Cohnella abietis]|uniref:Uncharacterized protein n=1 Tax=Cohnella abietis TaxID=2507935 RepID=A0A3T1CYN8_9BACL|nr:hypothetical protein KCTCHS21_02640 [Cohnella abietis]
MCGDVLFCVVLRSIEVNKESTNGGERTYKTVMLILGILVFYILDPHLCMKQLCNYLDNPLYS